MAKDQVQFLKEELGRIIKDFHLIEDNLYESELSHANNIGDYVYDVLLKKNAFKIEDLLNKLAAKYGLQSELHPTLILPDIKKFPLKYCLQNAIVPISESNTSVEFGICVPNSLNVLKNLSIMIGKKTTARFIPPQYIFESIQQKHIHTKADAPKSNSLENKKKVNIGDDKPKKIELGLEEMEVKLTKDQDEILDLEALGQKDKKNKIEENLDLSLLSKDINKPKKLEINIPESSSPEIELNLLQDESEVIQKDKLKSKKSKRKK